MEIIYNPQHIEEMKKPWRCKATAAFHFIVAAYTCLEDLVDLEEDGTRMCQDLHTLQMLENIIDHVENHNEVKEIANV